MNKDVAERIKEKITESTAVQVPDDKLTKLAESITDIVDDEVIKVIIAKWNLGELLKSFDLTIASKRKDNPNLYFVHGVYGLLDYKLGS